MSNLSGRKILMFCPSFYQYRDLIDKEINSLGADVFTYDERPLNSTWFKICLRLGLNKIVDSITENYYEDITLPKDDSEVTDVFVINAEAINKKIIESLKTRFIHAKFTLYMWDSIKNKKNVRDIIPLFDKTFSFDPKDCSECNSLNFEPLFYGHQFSKSNKEEDINVTFIGSIHSDRLKLVLDMFDYVDNSYMYLFSPSKLFSILKCIQYSLRIDTLNLISHEKLNVNTVSDIFGRSRCILDINHPDQNGLTMRTFEVLSAGKKLITTNSNIKKYEFYNENQIMVIGRNDQCHEQLSKFISTEFKENESFSKYRIDNWLKRILM